MGSITIYVVDDSITLTEIQCGGQGQVSNLRHVLNSEAISSDIGVGMGQMPID